MAHREHPGDSTHNRRIASILPSRSCLANSVIVAPDFGIKTSLPREPQASPEPFKALRVTGETGDAPC
eukprot:8040391-Alexandrium_andersonii.AAC.1